MPAMDLEYDESQANDMAISMPLPSPSRMLEKEILSNQDLTVLLRSLRTELNDLKNNIKKEREEQAQMKANADKERTTFEVEMKTQFQTLCGLVYEYNSGHRAIIDDLPKALELLIMTNVHHDVASMTIDGELRSKTASGGLSKIRSIGELVRHVNSNSLRFQPKNGLLDATLWTMDYLKNLLDVQSWNEVESIIEMVRSSQKQRNKRVHADIETMCDVTKTTEALRTEDALVENISELSRNDDSIRRIHAIYTRLLGRTVNNDDLFTKFQTQLEKLEMKK